MNIIKPSEWQPVGKLYFDQEGIESIKSNKNILIIAGPGSGKTEILAQRADYLFRTNQCAYPKKILAISFKVDSADNLKKRVISRMQSIEQRFDSLTYDAFAKSIVDRFKFALPEPLILNSRYSVNDFSIVEKAFQKIGYPSPPRYKKGKLYQYYENELIKNFESMTKDSKIFEIWKALLGGFDGNSGCLTFKMITALAISIIRRNLYIQKAIQQTYSYVFLDEFQDTTGLQHNFLKACFEESSCIITAVGDDKQRIMLWAGAKATIFSEFIQEFNAEYRELVFNHRSAPRLIALQKSMYHLLNIEPIDIKYGNHWNEYDGHIEVNLYDDDNAEAISITSDIYKRIADGEKPRDIGVLYKQQDNKYIQKLIKALQQKGIKARLEDPYQQSLKCIVTQIIIHLLLLVARRESAESWRFITEEFECYWEYKDSDDNFLYLNFLDKIDSLINDIRYRLTNINKKDDLRVLIEYILTMVDVKRLANRYNEYLNTDFLEQSKVNFIDLFWAGWDTSTDDLNQALDNFLGVDTIPVMTIHKSKGLEFQVVYLIGLEDDAFWNFKNQPSEECRVLFVAISRAIKSLIFTCCINRNSENQSFNYIKEFIRIIKTMDFIVISDYRIAK